MVLTPTYKNSKLHAQKSDVKNVASNPKLQIPDSSQSASTKKQSLSKNKLKNNPITNFELDKSIPQD